MIFDIKQLHRIAHRLRQAAGYLELGMAQQALDRLDDLGELGPFEGEVNLLRGEAYGAQEKFAEAAASFKTGCQALAASVSAARLSRPQHGVQRSRRYGPRRPGSGPALAPSIFPGRGNRNDPTRVPYENSTSPAPSTAMHGITAGLSPAGR